ncbi:MAG TPA: alpha/beta hydrolase [Terriglobia bacterium]|nr:alpha/beta hydrolase [Terriglobia bacterium]
MTVITTVLLPGLDGTGELFAPFVTAAPQGFRTIVVDYPTDETEIDALEQCAREKLTDSCIVIAESFSGPIGVRIAADDRVQALILCNSFIRNPISPAFQQFAIWPLFSISIPEFVLRFFLLGQEAHPALVKSTRSAIRRVPAHVIAHRVRQVLQTDERNMVRSLRKPVLYLRGLSDNLVSERNCRDLQTIRPDVEIVWIRGPHLLLQVSPEECWGAIQRFVEESGAA